MTAPLLDVRRVRRTFGGLHAVDDVSFAVEEGATLALIGPNGAGKTTLFNLVAGEVSASAGEVVFDGRDITAWPASRRCRLGIARSFQNLSLVPDESVLTNVLLKLHTCTGYGIADPWVRPGLTRRRESALRSHARQWIHAMGLDNYADTPIQSLSFGLARRAELAGLLAMEPRLLLLDEPTAGLSGPATDALLTALRRVQEQRPVTVLIIAHDLAFVLGYAREVIAMAEGRVIARGLPDDVRNHPAVVEAYIGTRAAGVHAGVAS